MRDAVVTVKIPGRSQAGTALRGFRPVSGAGISILAFKRSRSGVSV